MAEVSLKSSAHGFTHSLGLTRTPSHGPFTPGETDDPFHDPAMLGIGIAFIVMLLVILVLTGLIHWGIEYQSPSWNSHAYPPAVVH